MVHVSYTTPVDRGKHIRKREKIHLPFEKLILHNGEPVRVDVATEFCQEDDCTREQAL
jgi:hypothetical protein